MGGSKRPADVDALDFVAGRQNEQAPVNHVGKRQQRTKGLEVVFDPAALKDYVTGFGKRKKQRRKDALKQIEQKQRQQRILDRAERRAKLRQELQLDRYESGAGVAAADPGDDAAAFGDGSGEGGGDGDAGVDKVDVFDCGAFTTTVTTVAMHSDSEAAASDSEGGGSQGEERKGGEGQEGKGEGDGDDPGVRALQRVREAQRSAAAAAQRAQHVAANKALDSKLKKVKRQGSKSKVKKGNKGRQLD